MSSLTEFFNIQPNENLKGITHKNNIIKRNIIAYMAVNGECTLSELTKELHISVPTITKLVQELIEENIVNDLGKVETPGGRRPNVFGLANSAIYFAGVNVGRDNMTYVITDLQNNIIKEVIDTSFELQNRPQCLEKICSNIETFINECGIDRAKILGLGVSIVGRVNPETGRREPVPPHPLEYNTLNFFLGFMEYIKAHNSPIDFFSWHSYVDVTRMVVMDQWLHEKLKEFGYEGLETHLNEWDPFAQEFGTAHHSAEVAAMMLALQNGHVDLCCIYDMRTTNAPYCPLFDIRTHKPIHAYYSMVAFNTLYQLGTQVEAVSDNERVYAVAASDGTHHALMISNLSGTTQELNIEGVDLSKAKYHVIDQERLLSWSPAVSAIENNMVLLIEW